MRNLALYRYIDVTARTGSIRKAAELLAITPSSLNRRILSLEQELGAPLFERRARGVRLNTAGEQVVHVFRRHLAEAERLKGFVADLKGERRGSISIVCSQALLPSFLPRAIDEYRRHHPGVDFDVRVADGEEAGRALMDYEADLALIFSPLPSSDFQTITTVRQPLHALMAGDHPLAAHDTLGLADCLEHPLALPRRPYAVRVLLDLEADRMGLPLRPVVETESYILLRTIAALGAAVSFEIEIGLLADPTDGTVKRPLVLRTGEGGLLHLAQLRGRTLPVGAAKFADDVSRRLHQGDGRASG